MAPSPLYYAHLCVTSPVANNIIIGVLLSSSPSPPSHTYIGA